MESGTDKSPSGLKEYIKAALKHDFKNLSVISAISASSREEADEELISLIKTLAEEYGEYISAAEKIVGELAESKRQIEELLEYKNLQEENLMKSRGLYSAIITNMADALIVIDGDKKIISFNSAFASMFMLDPGLFIKENCPGLILGMSIESVLGGGIIGLVNNVFKSYADTSAVPDGEKLFSSEISLGGGRTGRAMATPMFVKPSAAGPSQPVSDKSARIFSGAVITVRDTTEEKETESMKSDFIRLMSHALKAPLTSVIGFSEIAHKKFTESILPLIDTEDKKIKKISGQIEGNLSIIAEEGKNLASLISDVLDIAKIESGNTGWKEENFSIRPLIDYSMKLTSSLFQQKGLSGELEIEEDLPEAFGDKEKYTQIIMSIISNAIKHSNEGTIKLAAESCENGIMITVADCGAGITKEKAEKLFDKFRPGGDAFSDGSSGTGLGLHVCSHIIKHYGGKIWVESEESKGSTFRFTVPTGFRSSCKPHADVI
ncbi:MAG: ATP-binding protein [Deltaproteobacteria bacterium]|nr:ATP-binding protein [Deltaproteobacteria bacterium]